MDWEEKNLTKWAEDWMQDFFLKAKIELPPVKGSEEPLTLSFFRVKVQGDASFSIKKGQRIPVFELQVDLSYKAELRLHGGKSSLPAMGELLFKEFSSEDPEEKIITDSTVPAGQDYLAPMLETIQESVKNDGLKSVKKILAEEFLEAMREAMPE